MILRPSDTASLTAAEVTSAPLWLWPTAPTLASLEPFRSAGEPGSHAGAFAGVPYAVESGAPCEWMEPPMRVPARSQMDVHLPPGTPPAAGWPMLIMARPNTRATFRKWISPGRPHRVVLEAALAAGYAVFNIDFRHPSVTLPHLPADEPAPFFDMECAIQQARALHAALRLDRSQVVIFGRSRGALALQAALAPNRAQPHASRYAAQQASDGIAAVWAQQPRLSLVMSQMAQLYVVPDERAKAVAARPSDARLEAQPSLYDMLRAGVRADTRIWWETNDPWWGRPVSCDEYLSVDVVHFADAGRLLRQHLIDAGRGHQVVVNHGSPAGLPHTYARVVPWFEAVRQAPAGVSAAACAARVEAQLTGAQLFVPAAADDGLGDHGGDGDGDRVLVDAQAAWPALAPAAPQAAPSGRWLLHVPAAEAALLYPPEPAQLWLATTAGWAPHALRPLPGREGWWAVDVGPCGVGLGVLHRGRMSAVGARLYKQLGMERTGVRYTLDSMSPATEGSVS